MMDDKSVHKEEMLKLLQEARKLKQEGMTAEAEKFYSEALDLAERLSSTWYFLQIEDEWRTI